MKNIHILPTNKPSRLIKSQDNDFVYLNTNAPNWFENNLKTTKQNIYITSDEEIKEGDWVTNGLTIMIANLDGQPTMDDYHPWKKIILTTDQDLIKDGVQEIDDEFLKWFVKNPSCEEVGIEPLMAGFVDDEPSYYENMYDIIIPQEEPKRKIDTCYNFDMEIGCVQDICRCEQEEPKQENCCTPESQIKRYVDCVGCDRKPKEMSKPTALDLYEKEINSLIERYEEKEISKREFITMKHNIFYQANEMFKQQIIDAYDSKVIETLANEYYNETFNK